MHHDFATTSPSVDPDEEHVIIAAFTVMARDEREAHESLQQRLHRNLASQDATSPIESWWIAQDNRKDGSDNDSAIFVKPGDTFVAATLLHAVGLTASYNIPGPSADGGQFDTPDRASNPTLQEVKERLLEWLATPPEEGF